MRKNMCLLVSFKLFDDKTHSSFRKKKNQNNFSNDLRQVFVALEIHQFTLTGVIAGVKELEKYFA